MNSETTATYLTKFSLNESQAIKEYYESYGYVILENLLSSAKINNFLSSYEKIKKHPYFIYYSQSIHLPLKPELTPEGFIKESILNPVNLKLFPEFSNSVLDCLVEDNIATVLSILSGEKSHTIWQNMFFDKSTGTIEHQDHYYLDTNPSGGLIGVWYALENIQLESGCFFVLPGSHKGEVIHRQNYQGKSQAFFSDHDMMRQKIQQMIKDNHYEYRALSVNKGDVIFWHPYTIHGSFSNQNPALSRKSFTAHFYPSHLARGDQKILLVKPSNNPNILIENADLKFWLWHLKLYLKYFFNQLRKQPPIMDMRRTNYTDDN